MINYMTLEQIATLLDAGLDLEEVSLLGQLVGKLRDAGVTDEIEMIRAMLLTVTLYRNGVHA